LDDTFKSRSELEELTGTNVLTSIPKFTVKEEE
jgi:capsular polysaccharide biosynthesis protein